MYEHDKQMLNEIEEDFKNGLKVSNRGYLNLDDEQIEWMIKTIKSYDQSVYYYETYTDQQFKGNLNLLEIKRELEKQISLKDAQIQDLTVMCRGLKREIVNLECELNKIHLDYKNNLYRELTDLERKTFGLGDDF
jgi:hypothetical protein